MKKNILKIIAIVLCMAVLTVAFASCSGKKADNSSGKNEAVGNANGGENSGNAENGSQGEGQNAGEAAQGESATKANITGVLVGKWAYVNGGGFYYIFNDNGTGTYTAGDSVTDFTYSDDGSKVWIKNNDLSEAVEHVFTIDGNRMKITDTFGDTVEYIKRDN